METLFNIMGSPFNSLAMGWLTEGQVMAELQDVVILSTAEAKAEPQEKVTSTEVAIVASRQPAHYEFPRPAGKGKRTEKVVSPSRE
jgi:hypothetical protein